MVDGWLDWFENLSDNVDSWTDWSLGRTGMNGFEFKLSIDKLKFPQRLLWPESITMDFRDVYIKKHVVRKSSQITLIVIASLVRYWYYTDSSIHSTKQ